MLLPGTRIHCSVMAGKADVQNDLLCVMWDVKFCLHSDVVTHCISVPSANRQLAGYPHLQSRSVAENEAKFGACLHILA